jgi:hypothetical protein
MLSSRWPAGFLDRCGSPGLCLAGSGPYGPHDVLGFGILPRGLLGVDDIPVHRDLEDPAARGNDHQLGDLELEFF